MKDRRVFVATSGGVDSSVAALLLKKAGYAVTGVFIRGYNLDGCGEQEAEDARRVAAKIGIPFYVFDFEKEYKERIVEYLVAGYRSGITPNPDVLCNKEIKFGLFLEKALELGANCIATGHYVRLSTNGEFNANKRIQGFDGVHQFVNSRQIRYSLMTAKDNNKDQSYFLWMLTQQQLKHCLFPIGDYLKSEVREMARVAGLPNAEKKDSQGICFLGKISLSGFLKTQIPEREGVVVTPEGRKIGTHRGAWFYTVGQRHGFDIRSKKQEASAGGDMLPHYVVEKNVATNTLTVAEGSKSPSLKTKAVTLKNLNLINPDSSLKIHDSRVMARIRYREPLTVARLQLQGSDSATITFDEAQRFVAPGQSAVFYTRSGEMLGGGVITD